MNKLTEKARSISMVLNRSMIEMDTAAKRNTHFALFHCVNQEEGNSSLVTAHFNILKHSPPTTNEGMQQDKVIAIKNYNHHVTLTATLIVKKHYNTASTMFVN